MKIRGGHFEDNAKNICHDINTISQVITDLQTNTDLIEYGIPVVHHLVHESVDWLSNSFHIFNNIAAERKKYNIDIKWVHVIILFLYKYFLYYIWWFWKYTMLLWRLIN